MKFTWKKIFSLSLAAVMALSLAACGQSNGTDDSQSTSQSKETPPSSTTQEPSNSTSTPTTSTPDAAEPTGDSNVLVVYYSASGNTEAVAGYIAEATGGDLFAITPAEPYTSDDLNWTDENSRVSQEYADESLRDVELTTTEVENWDSYDTVFIGYPIWWGIAAWPTDSFVEANDFTGKTVIPFCTSSSSGLGQSGELLAELAGTGDWLEGQRFRSGVSQEDVNEWVDSLGQDNPYVAKIHAVLDKAIVYEAHGEYASCSDYGGWLTIPIKEGAYCGLNTYVPAQYPMYLEGDQMTFFTTLRWYRDAGFWRSDFYNRFELQEEKK